MLHKLPNLKILPLGTKKKKEIWPRRWNYTHQEHTVAHNPALWATAPNSLFMYFSKLIKVYRDVPDEGSRYSAGGGCT